MRIDRILEERRPVFSFEFFPPKTDEGQATLENTLAVLKDDRPDYVSVTYGAGGSTRDRTVEITKWIKEDLGIEAMAHLSCVGEPTQRVIEILGELRDCGIENVLALRGDPPRGEAEWRPHPEGLHHSVELIQTIRDQFDFCIGAACFPEVHPQATDMDADIGFLKKKVESGARFLISQLFFDNDLYFEFVDKARAAGIDVPIIPGIMPVTNYAQLKRFTEMCAASIPPRYEAELASRKDEPEAVRELGVAYATMQCADLLERGAPGIHFYVLNKSPSARAILATLRAGGYGSRTLTPA
jgi:methylenetetrahydrofolate reductase (NADPH)